VWVPNRNGVFINLAAAFAESLEASLIITGFNAEEAATFPDNSPQYVEAINEALSFSTQNQVQVFSPTQNLNKTEIVNLGLQLALPWELVWSCYKEGDSAGRMCGECESCRRFMRATQAAGVWDRVKERFANHAH
jgi:7-cyano-7-deazaguanine synthase